jgi:hypothetical protein
MTTDFCRLRLFIVKCVILLFFSGSVSHITAKDLIPGLPDPDSNTPGWLQRFTSRQSKVTETQTSGVKYVTVEPEKKTSFLEKLRGSKDKEDYKSAGREALSKNRIDEAYYIYRRALQDDPYDPEYHYGMGAVMAARGKRKEAAKYLNYAIQSGTDVVPDACQTMTNLQVGAQNYDAARDSAQSLGKWAEQKGNRLMAIDAWLLAARISNTYMHDKPGTFYNLEKAKSLLNAGDLEAAKRVHSFEDDLKKPGAI